VVQNFKILIRLQFQPLHSSTSQVGWHFAIHIQDFHRRVRLPFAKLSAKGQSFSNANSQPSLAGATLGVNETEITLREPITK
jgi:hypothetical protein